MTDTVVTQADIVRALDRAIDKIMGIEIEAMGGDNLAVTLCSHFDDPDGGELDDNGWSQAATDAYDEIKAEIAGKFVPVREAIDAFARQRQASTQELVEALEKAERAIAEYYRYWTGGETRGSYDGKPERQGLWEAQRRARTTLSRYRGEG